MRKVTVNQAVKQSLKYPGVRLAFTPFSVYLACLNNGGFVETSYISTQERMEWAEMVLQAYGRLTK